jgi:hypothetical protein
VATRHRDDLPRPRATQDRFRTDQERFRAIDDARRLNPLPAAARAEWTRLRDTLLEEGLRRQTEALRGTGGERRASPRTDASVPCAFGLTATSTHRGFVTSTSLFGTRVHGVPPPKRGEILHLKLELEGATVRMKGRVSWVDPVTSPPTFAVAFDGHDEKAADELTRWIVLHLEVD